MHVTPYKIPAQISDREASRNNKAEKLYGDGRQIPFFCAKNEKNKNVKRNSFDVKTVTHPILIFYITAKKNDIYQPLYVKHTQTANRVLFQRWNGIIRRLNINEQSYRSIR